MPYVRFDVRPGTAERIARFYRDVMHAPSDVAKNGAGPEARVQVGEKQYFYFRETDAPEAALRPRTTCKSTSPISPARIAGSWSSA